jgi:hypothetical protein
MKLKMLALNQNGSNNFTGTGRWFVWFQKKKNTMPPTLNTLERYTSANDVYILSLFLDGNVYVKLRCFK